MLFAVQGAKKLPENSNLRKIHNQFGQHNHRRTAHRQTAKRFCQTVRNWFSKSIVSHETMQELLLGKPIATGSAESLRCLPLCCSPMVVLSELRMNTS